MTILFIGDIFSSVGRRIVADHLADIKQTQQIDLAIANAENAAGGFGITPTIAEELFALGLDVLTSGNHIWDKKEIYDYFARRPTLLRPANYAAPAPGSGVIVVPSRNGSQCAVINLQGRIYMPSTECPFRKADEILASLESTKVRFVDFHAELTSEKMAMGWYLDGRVTAVVGTHTHVATADEQILPQGTAFITDVGMTGPHAGVIGMDREAIVKRFLDGLPARFEVASGDVQMNCVLIETLSPAERNVGGRLRARSIERLSLRAD